MLEHNGRVFLVHVHSVHVAVNPKPPGKWKLRVTQESIREANKYAQGFKWVKRI